MSWIVAIDVDNQQCNTYASTLGMVLQTPQQPPSSEPDVEAGVIDDARSRQRKQRWIGAAVIVALVAAGSIVGFGGGGGGPGGNGADPGGPGVPLPSETLSLQAPKPGVLAGVIRHCDKQANGRLRRFPATGGAKNPFATGLVLSGAVGPYVGLIAVVDGQELSCVDPLRRGGYYPGGGGEGPVGLAPASGKLTGDGWGTFGALLGSVSETDGRAGRNVSAVEFVFAHHRGVRARVENGWYLAMWPHKQGEALNRNVGPTSVLVTTSSGTRSSPMSGTRCYDHPSACVFVKPPALTRPHRPNPRLPSPSSGAGNGAGPTLKQLLANFAVLRRGQTAADRSWKPPCDCGTTVQIRKLTRLATALPNGYRVFLDVKRATSSGSQFLPGSYLLGLNLVNRSGDASSVEFGSNTQYSIYPISTGRMGFRGSSPLYAPHGNQAFASLVPDGVATVKWTVDVRCPKIASSHGVHCPTPGSQTFTVPVVNNIAARLLPGVDSDQFYADISKVSWLGRGGRVIAAFNGYGNLAAPPFLAGHLNTGNRSILTGTGIAGARIGESTAHAIQMITRLLGPAAYANAASGCGIDHQTVWDSPTTADPLTVYSQAGRFVGYQYGAPPAQIGMKQGPGAVLTTKNGLTLSMPIGAAKRLYPNDVATVSSPRLGRFSITDQANRIYGYALPNTYPAHSVSNRDPIATIGAGNTGCPQTP